MVTVKKGRKEFQVVLDPESQVYTTLIEWAKARSIAPGVALRIIAVDWADAKNGIINPFAQAMAPVFGGQMTTPMATQSRETAELEEISPEEKLRRDAAFDASDQFV